MVTGAKYVELKGVACLQKGGGGGERDGDIYAT